MVSSMSYGIAMKLTLKLMESATGANQSWFFDRKCLEWLAHMLTFYTANIEYLVNIKLVFKHYNDR